MMYSLMALHSNPLLITRVNISRMPRVLPGRLRTDSCPLLKGGTMTTQFELFTYAVYNSLGVGYAQARTRKELCQTLRCGDRVLRKAIEHLRGDYPVLTCDDGKGYYLPETGEKGIQDAERWVRRQNRRIRSIKEAEAGAVKFIGQQSEKISRQSTRIRQVPGQIGFSLVGGG